MKSQRGGITDFMVFCIFMYFFGPLILLAVFGMAARYSNEHSVNTNPISQPYTQPAPPQVKPAPPSSTFMVTYVGSDTSEIKYGETATVDEHQGGCRVTPEYLIRTTEMPAGFVWCGELPDFFWREQ